MEGEAMTRVEPNTPAQTIFLPRRWQTEDERGCAPGLSLRMSCQAIRSARPDGRTPWIVRVAGALDCSTSEELREKINGLLAVDQPDRLILDLEGVTHIDSSGLGTLLAGMREANDRQVRFTLSGLNISLRHTLERTRLYSLFEIRPTLQDALLT